MTDQTPPYNEGLDAHHFGYAQPAPAPDAVPLFWYRPCRGGLYEGPHHHNSVGGRMLRDEKPGEWVPLYAGAAPVAQQVEPMADDYGSTDFGYTFAGIQLAEGDKRLMSLLVRALGSDHPAIDDLTALLFRAAAHPQHPAPQPLTDAALCAMRAKQFDENDAPAWAYEKGVRDAEHAHGITATPAPTTGEG